MSACHHLPYIFPSHFFFFNDTAPTEIYTLSLHDALPICAEHHREDSGDGGRHPRDRGSDLSRHQHQRHRLLYAAAVRRGGDRKSTRLNSSHSQISYAVFCLKKKKKITK